MAWLHYGLRPATFPLADSPVSLIFASTILAALSWLGNTGRRSTGCRCPTSIRIDTTPDTAIDGLPGLMVAARTVGSRRTANFRTVLARPRQTFESLAAACERPALALLESVGSVTRTLAAWTPFCEAVVHPDTNAYVVCVGLLRGAKRLSGCSTTRPRSRAMVVPRRIDLRCRWLDWNTESLPQ